MTPSPKEKAKELFKDMYTIIFDIDNGASVMHDQARYDAAKRAAVKTVDEIINSSPTNPLKGGYIGLYSDMVDEAIEYYKEVKQELEKL
jgi:hypothetical protein